ncbi:MAG: hypothetical protein ACREC6_09720 [Hyphomicrobiaceae bacterium]
MHTTASFVVDVQASQIEDLDREFLGAAMAQIHPKIVEWRGAALESDLRDAQKNVLDLLVDEADAQRYAEEMHVLGLPARSFKCRLIEIEGVRSIAGINFRDVSGEFPHVRLLRASAALGTIVDWSSLKSGLSQVFCEFKPRSVLFFHSAHVPLNAPTTGIDDYLLAAPARTVAERPRAVGFERVALRRSTSLEFYPRYKAVYEAVFAERPVLCGEVRVETKKSLADCLAAGFLFEIFVDDEWAGVMAADRRTIAGVHGIYIVEIVLTKEMRGRRLGAAVHQRFAAEAAPADVILGTISAKNPWSRQTALRAGRIEIGAWHWVGLY